MTFSPMMMVILPLVAAALLLCLVFVRRRRQSSVAFSKYTEQEAGLRDAELRLSDLIADLDLRHGSVLDNLSHSINTIASSVEWLAGERMIEQAIAMAQSGSPAESISEKMGLSLDDARTILQFRRH